MAGALRFEVLITPNATWATVLHRFRRIEALGFDLGGLADHFVDWTNPPNPWFDLWSTLGAVAQATTTLRLRPCVAQIPLRDPATFARQALSLDHISGGRIELGLGIGLTVDPSYEMMGIPNWSPRERVARLKEYLEIVDLMLVNEVTSYSGRVLPDQRSGDESAPGAVAASADHARGDGSGDAQAQRHATRTRGTA